MGYRSEVRVAMLREDYMEMLEELQNQGNIMYILGAVDYKAQDEDTGVIVFGWDWIKWYPEDPDINKLDTFIKSRKVISFVRLGEDWGDIEEYHLYGEDDSDFRCDILHPFAEIDCDLDH